MAIYPATATLSFAKPAPLHLVAAVMFSKLGAVMGNKVGTFHIGNGIRVTADGTDSLVSSLRCSEVLCDESVSCQDLVHVVRTLRDDETLAAYHSASHLFVQETSPLVRQALIEADVFDRLLNEQRIAFRVSPNKTKLAVASMAEDLAAAELSKAEVRALGSALLKLADTMVFAAG